MKVHIAAAVAEHTGRTVEVYVGDDETPTLVREVTDEDGAEDTAVDGDSADAAPTEREKRLREEIADIERGGPQKYRDRLTEQGKLFVRDRLELWFGDDGLDFEDGRFANFDSWHPSSPDVDDEDDRLPADGLITGAGTFEADRYMSPPTTSPSRRDQSLATASRSSSDCKSALKSGQPLLYLVDSSGGRIDQQRGFFANREGIGKFYYNHSLLSGAVPQICVLYGPCIAGAAYTPVFADFTVMVRGMSALAIASPRMVEMVTGEDIDLETLGGPDLHARHSGSADLVADDEDHARELVAQLITYLPDNADEKPPRTDGTAPAVDPAGLDSVIPAEPNKGYDMHRVIEHIVDADSFFELQSEYGAEILTGFARVDGRPVGIVANQPSQRAGAIFPDSARKAAGFVWTCDAYNIPLLYLCDTPGSWQAPRSKRRAYWKPGSG